MTPITEHFSWEEASFSSTASRLGIDNTIPEEVKNAVRRTAVNMEKVRTVLGKSIHIDSWYRCKELNDSLGSKETSQHRKGEAVDFVCPEFGTPLDIARAIINAGALIRFDQLILEHTWIHISFCSIPGTIPRGQVLSLLKSKNYALGLTNPEGVSYGIA